MPFWYYSYDYKHSIIIFFNQAFYPVQQVGWEIIKAESVSPEFAAEKYPGWYKNGIAAKWHIHFVLPHIYDIFFLIA